MVCLSNVHFLTYVTMVCVATLKEDGGLEHLDAISVHPHRIGGPQSVLPNYARLRALLDQYQRQHQIPIVSGEWGWSDCTAPCTPLLSNPARVPNEVVQARFLVRSFLVKAMANVSLHIW
jgi:hypothetical protein